MIDDIVGKLLSQLRKTDDGLFRNSFLDGTLEGEFLNQFDVISQHIADVNDKLGLNKPILAIMPPGPSVSDYQTFPAAQIRKTVNYFEEYLASYEGSLSELQTIVVSSYKTAKDTEMQKLKPLLKKGIKITPGDDLATFRRKNRNHKLYSNMKDQQILYVLSFTDKILSVEKDYAFIMEQLNASRSILRQGIAITHNLNISLNIIEDLRDHPNILKAEADKNLISLIRGDIKGSTARKLIYANPAKEAQVPMSSVSFKEQRIDTIVERKTYNEEELSFLDSRGIKPNTAKGLLDRKNYAEIKEFILSLESVFEKKGIDTKEAQVIYQKWPVVLQRSTKDLLAYAQMVDNLYDIHDPKTATGILPRFNPNLYESTNSLSDYLDKKSDTATNVKIIGLDKITNPANRSLLENKLKISPFSGEQVKKWIDKLGGKKTSMYQTYSDIAGEGHYRKMKFGHDRRAIFKVSNESNGNYTINIIEYFETHNAHSRFFQT